jgi:hypothetical protein
VRISLSRLFAGNCEHLETVVIRSAGVERVVCELCGHLSFSIEELPTEPLDMSQVSPDPAAVSGF